jgi:inhibitor of KinA
MGLFKPHAQLTPVGDSAILISFGNRIDPTINHQVHSLARRLLKEQVKGLGEAVPAYSTLLVHYDPLLISFEAVDTIINKLVSNDADEEPDDHKLVEIPTVYGGIYGTDLEYVAHLHGTSPQEVIDIHCQSIYDVFLIGFTPGFAYLGMLDGRIETPRKENPRALIKAGSVGIAGQQTGIYPMDSPGGWQIIGYTALKLFDISRTPSCLLNPGDSVRFVSISNEDLLNASI